jgi:hypothetical protein
MNFEGSMLNFYRLVTALFRISVVEAEPAGIFDEAPR